MENEFTFVEIIDSMIAKLTEAKADAAKCDGGQAGNPGTRVRKVMAEVRETAGQVRKDILAARKG